MNAVIMYLTGKEKIELNSEEIMGKMETEGEYKVFGKYSGQHFVAEVVTEKYITNLSFLVCDITEALGNLEDHLGRPLDGFDEESPEEPPEGPCPLSYQRVCQHRNLAGDTH